MKLAISAISMGAAIVALTAAFSLAAEKPADGKKKLLFYSQSFGFRHSVVTRPLSGELSHAEKVLKEIGAKAGYEVDVTQDCHDMRDLKRLKQYDGIVLYTTGNPLINRDALMQYLREGGALIGIHTATDTFHHDADYAKGWPEYIKVIGAAFKTHGHQAPTRMKIHDTDHPSTSMLQSGWTVTDEIYLFDRFNEDVQLLISVDTDTMDDETLGKLKMKKGEFHPVAWTNTVGQGRVFYTSLGHREDVWTDPVYQKHLLGGIAWALGQAE